MPFTLLFARLLAALAVLLLAASALQAPDAAALAASTLVWLALIGVPVSVAESLGLLSRAAGFFFGRRH